MLHVQWVEWGSRGSARVWDRVVIETTVDPGGFAEASVSFSTLTVHAGYHRVHVLPTCLLTRAVACLPLPSNLASVLMSCQPVSITAVSVAEGFFERLCMACWSPQRPQQQ
jgi:hypothetical protein